MRNDMLRYCLASFLALLAALSASAQRTLNGKITSADGKPLAGAIIQVYDGDKNVRAGAEWRHTTLMDGGHKTSLLLDARAEYKITKKKLRLRLELNNLLNKKAYNYTVYSSLNSYTYDYRLRGREFLLSLIWM